MSVDTQQPVVKVYQLKVSLRDISPMIWRRLLVASDTSIAQLHTILQIAMGWEDLHLHRFRVHGKDYGIAQIGGIFFDDDPFHVKLSAFKLRAGERFVYEYDLGDFWQHDIRLERILPLDPRKRYPICSDGAGDCPPEDCGGPLEYMSLLEERSSLLELLQLQEDMLLIAERLLEHAEGGPRPTSDDRDFLAALERLRARQDDAPIAFNRRAVNAALRTL